jgi:hypothetical protein
VAAQPRIKLLPIDIDVVHPATGEMSESRESSEGGYVAIRRDEGTPITKLKLHKLEGLQGAQFKLSWTSSKLKIWKDEERTQSVTTNSTTFPAGDDTEVFLEGVTKSSSVKDIEVGLKVIIGSTESSPVPIKLTVVEGEFDVQAKMWIREQWIETPFLHPINYSGYKIARGDDRDNRNQQAASYRVSHFTTIIPYKDLDLDGIKDNHSPYLYTRNVPGLSALYLKSTSVPNPSQPYSLSNKLLSTATATNSMPPDVSRMHVDAVTRSDEKKASVRLHGSANDPLVPFSLDIDWDITVAIDATNVLSPKYEIQGTHDDYPAFEIDLEDSIGRRSNQPYFKLHPLPSNVFDLAPGGSITIPANTKGNVR